MVYLTELMLLGTAKISEVYHKMTNKFGCKSKIKAWDFVKGSNNIYGPMLWLTPQILRLV